MCNTDGGSHDHDAGPIGLTPRGLPKIELDLDSAARAITAQEEIRCHHVGFVGYGSTKPGDRVLLAIDSHYDRAVVDAFTDALRRAGAAVDTLTLDAGPDRPFDYLDEIEVVMRRGPWRDAPRRWEGVPWVEDLAETRGYDLLIHGKGGPIPQTTYRYEQIPWLEAEQLASAATTYPLEVHRLINRKTWDVIWTHGRGGRVRITDPEGTDFSYTLHEGYYDESRRGFTRNPVRSYSHLLGHPPPPFLPEEDATGVCAGTTSHYTRAFPRATVRLEGGQITSIQGGGPYGDAWGELIDEARAIRYPCFPRPGLFYIWEVAIGTNPKIRRPRGIEHLSSGGFEWERRRSGVIHLGFGTRWRGSEELWAAEQGVLYGHLHIHLLFPTFTVTSRDGEPRDIIRNGRLTALDDPEVRELAARYGDPDELLREDWIPEVPGITLPGEYGAYAIDPGRWIYGTPSAP
jgi:hypothetical protein